MTTTQELVKNLIANDTYVIYDEPEYKFCDITITDEDAVRLHDAKSYPLVEANTDVMRVFCENLGVRIAEFTHVIEVEENGVTAYFLAWNFAPEYIVAINDFKAVVVESRDSYFLINADLGVAEYSVTDFTLEDAVISYYYSFDENPDQPAFEVKGIRTYDVLYNDDNSSDSKGFKESYQFCKEYIKDNYSDFKDGTVAICCNDTESTMYEEDVK